MPGQQAMSQLLVHIHRRHSHHKIAPTAPTVAPRQDSQNQVVAEHLVWPAAKGKLRLCHAKPGSRRLGQKIRNFTLCSGTACGAPSTSGVRMAAKCLMANANSSKDFAGGAPSTSGVGVAVKCLMATANSSKNFALIIVVLRGVLIRHIELH